MPCPCLMFLKYYNESGIRFDYRKYEGLKGELFPSAGYRDQVLSEMGL